MLCRSHDILQFSTPWSDPDQLSSLWQLGWIDELQTLMVYVKHRPYLDIQAEVIKTSTNRSTIVLMIPLLFYFGRPIVNFTHSKQESYPKVLANALESVLTAASLPVSWAPTLARLPWRGRGCTGIIARNSADGTVSHARDLDFSPAILGDLVYTGIFKKGGKEIFRAQLIAG